MAVNGCCSSLVGAALIAVLFLPAQYYFPDLRVYLAAEAPLAVTEFENPPVKYSWCDFGFNLSPFDFVVTAILLVFCMLIYLWEWIQIKIMERRIVKLNQYLGVSLERLREWDAQQEQLEVTLKMLQNATSEYNLLLYLLLRQHRCLTGHNPASPKRV